MQKIEDKIVYTTLEEIVDPSHTALVINFDYNEVN
jgi:hypothetical protein